MAKGFMVKGKEYVQEQPYPDGALYWEGEEFVSKTGGWDYIENSTSGTTTRTKETDHLYLQLASPNNTFESATGIVNKIDLTNVSVIKAYVEFTRSGTGTYDRAYFTVGATHTTDTAYTFVSSNFTGEISVNVASVSGLNYVEFDVVCQSGQTSTIKVYKVWCE